MTQRFTAEPHNIHTKMHHVSTPQSLFLMLLMQRGRNLMSCLPALDCQAFWHTQTHTHTQINVIYGIITSMTVQMQAYHSILLNYGGKDNSVHTIQTDRSMTSITDPNTSNDTPTVIQQISTHKMISQTSQKKKINWCFLSGLFFLSKMKLFEILKILNSCSNFQSHKQTLEVRLNHQNGIVFPFNIHYHSNSG